LLAERTNPGDAQLGERDALTTRYGRQAIYEPEFTSDTLEASGDVSKRRGGERKNIYVISERNERALRIAFEVQTVLGMVGE
jgi:hypothetical protein